MVQVNQTGAPLITPDDFDAVIFDMDGIVTRTATVHFAAWKKTFDAMLEQRVGKEYSPFSQHDYLQYVDGKPRKDGIRSFLGSRSIELPEGTADDPAGYDTINALARLKTDEFLNSIHTHGVEAYETTVALIRSLRNVGIGIGLVTASKNGYEILEVTHLEQLFDAIVTGVEAQQLNLAGKPAPDTFLECARKLDVSPDRAVIVEDAEAGVEAGWNGHFGMVIGVARHKNYDSLKKHGASYVVSDLAEVPLLTNGAEQVGMALAEMDVTEANWVVAYDTFEPEKEAKRESLCALGNGKFCTRGAAPWSSSDGVHYPATYLAGGYNTVWLNAEGRTFEREELVNMPNWVSVKFRIEDDEWFDEQDVELISYFQRLDLRKGLLNRELTWRDKAGRETRLTERRFVHMRYSHVAGVEVSLTALNWSGKVTIVSALDGTVTNRGDEIDPSSQGTRHLEALESDVQGEMLFLKMQTSRTKLVVAQAAKTLFLKDGQPIDPIRKATKRDDYVDQQVEIELEHSNRILIRKTLNMYTSRDRGIYEAGFTAREALESVPDFETLIREQVLAWRSLWRQYDLFIETSEEHSKLVPSLLLHLNSFHTLQTASPHTVDLDTGVPARGWTGEGYQGHIFWDDLFVFPFVNLRMPNISAALLKYRYRRINEAKKIAAAHGARGACFPWESASDGREMTPKFSWMKEKQKWVPVYTQLEIHVNGAIAYNVWQYYQVTLDVDFMYSYGSEILFEIARFFASYAKFNTEKSRYEINGVVGPDEYHNHYPGSDKPGINNNAYTNVLAVWTLCRALELLETLPSDHRAHIRQRLKITDDEVALWEQVSRRMFVPFMENGIISQYDGYEKLDEFPWLKDGVIEKEELTRALIENDGSLNQYKLSKQADVLMLGFLFTPTELKELFTRLGYEYSYSTVAINAEYYMPRTVNGSTLSRVAHAWVLSRLNRLWVRKLLPFCQLCEKESGGDNATEIFYEALGSDFYDVAARGTAKTGIHMGAMAGTVDIVQRCYTGLSTRGDVLWLDPQLPKPLLHLSFNVHYRRQSLSIDITPETIKITARHSTAEPIKIGYRNQVYTIKCGETKVINLLDQPAPGQRAA